MRSLSTISIAIMLACTAAACGDDAPAGGNLDASAPGIDSALEPDGAAMCGNGMIEPPEQCDDTNNNDDDACHNDCTAACGDGVLVAGELCDPGIAAGSEGACPSDCDDSDACTTDSLDGTFCQLACSHGTISVPTNGDGCCPEGANADTDDDCVAGCGDGVVTAGETCDTAIAAGSPGACPTSCNDNMVCTTDALANGGTCTAACSNTVITMPANNDGCCPSGATIGNDNDCSAGCGDGVVTPPETCDTAIAAGAGSCPTMASCNDSMACTVDSVISGGTCSAACNHVAITMPINGDGCCPAGANANNDNNCTPVCPNGVMESGEQCDDGNMNNGDACSNTCQTNIVATAFRFSDMDLRDPHVFVNFFGCQDVTDSPLFTFPGVNPQLQTSMTTDTDDPPDGILNLSLVLVFRPLAQALASSPLGLAFPDCTAPIGSTSCTLNAPDVETPSTATNMAAGTCLTTLMNTAFGYSPAITPTTATAGAACFTSDEETITITLSGINIVLHNARVAARYSGNPATGLTTGLVRGFISEADANATILPMDLPLIGGMPLSSVLAGGNGACNPGHSDKDIGPDGTTPGWWFYLNFTATKAPYSAP